MLRSSLGKKGLILPNGVGIIDLDYKDEIKMIIHNPIQGNVIIFPDTEIKYHEMYSIKKGDKIAQITLLEHKAQMFGIETENERSGGFGSTGAGRNEG
jgi:dUTP pyrophosphatase